MNITSIQHCLYYRYDYGKDVSVISCREGVFPLIFLWTEHLKTQIGYKCYDYYKTLVSIVKLLNDIYKEDCILTSYLLNHYLYIKRICARQDAELSDPHRTESPMNLLLLVGQSVILYCLSVCLSVFQFGVLLKNCFEQG